VISALPSLRVEGWQPRQSPAHGRDLCGVIFMIIHPETGECLENFHGEVIPEIVAEKTKWFLFELARCGFYKLGGPLMVRLDGECLVVSLIPEHKRTYRRAPTRSASVIPAESRYPQSVCTCYGNHDACECARDRLDISLHK